MENTHPARPPSITGIDYAIIFNVASNGMAFTEADTGRIVDVNEAWIRATGIARQDAIGRTALALGLWADSAERTAGPMVAAGGVRAGPVVCAPRTPLRKSAPMRLPPACVRGGVAEVPRYTS